MIPYKKVFLICAVSICFLRGIGQKITASYTRSASEANFSGRVFLYLSKDSKSPKDEMIGVQKFPCFSITVKNVHPNQKVVFDDAATYYPVILSDIERGKYHAQVVWDRNEGGRSIGESPGNMYNQSLVVNLTKNTRQSFDIVCNEVNKEQPFVETRYIKELKAPSALLTAFYKRTTTLNAAILLPKEYFEQPDRKFPVLRTNVARLLTGHSSGGWSVLWLQTHYPKIFTACWSSSPDPVDFRSFQQINLYNDKNMYYANDSTLQLAATIAGRYPWIFMKDMCAMEHVIWRGEQMHSFNFVFSTRNRDGTPRSLWNDITGDIDRTTLEHWKSYDISIYVKSNWKQLKAYLQGKIRVSVGNQDNFLLNYPVHLFDDEMKKIDAGFVFAYYPGDHFTVFTPEYKTAGYQFLEMKYHELTNK